MSSEEITKIINFITLYGSDLINKVIVLVVIVLFIIVLLAVIKTMRSVKN